MHLPVSSDAGPSTFLTGWQITFRPNGVGPQVVKSVPSEGYPRVIPLETNKFAQPTSRICNQHGKKGGLYAYDYVPWKVTIWDPECCENLCRIDISLYGPTLRVGPRLGNLCLTSTVTLNPKLCPASCFRKSWIKYQGLLKLWTQMEIVNFFINARSQSRLPQKIRIFRGRLQPSAHTFSLQNPKWLQKSSKLSAFSAASELGGGRAPGTHELWRVLSSGIGKSLLLSVLGIKYFMVRRQHPATGF